MDQPLYRHNSSLQFLRLLLLRLLTIGLIVYFATVFSENPPLLGTLILLCALFVVFIGDSDLLLYHDRIVLREYSLFQWLRPRPRHFPLKSLRRVFVDEPSTEEPDGGAVVLLVLVRMFIPRRTLRPSPTVLLHIEYLDGKTRPFYSVEDLEEARAIAARINRQIDAAESPRT